MSLVTDMNTVVGTSNLLFVTLDTLRYDVATDALEAGLTPNFGSVLPGGSWERRHTPGSFTYAAHAAFFAGFLPTPADPGLHERPFALAFSGSETIGRSTCVLDGADIVVGLRRLGYHSVCVGGVGFFNLANPLACALPGLFDERHWSAEMGVTSAESFERQIDCVAEVLAVLDPSTLVFLFLNVSALHQPNCIFSTDAVVDSPATQRDALAYVDRHVPTLLEVLGRHGAWHAIVCSDHGTAYGEDDFVGHRIAHEVVWTVPYAEFSVSAL